MTSRPSTHLIGIDGRRYPLRGGRALNEGAVFAFTPDRSGQRADDLAPLEQEPDLRALLVSGFAGCPPNQAAPRFLQLPAALRAELAAAAEDLPPAVRLALGGALLPLLSPGRGAALLVRLATRSPGWRPPVIPDGIAELLAPWAGITHLPGLERSLRLSQIARLPTPAAKRALGRFLQREPLTADGVDLSGAAPERIADLLTPDGYEAIPPAARAQLAIQAERVGRPWPLAALVGMAPADQRRLFLASARAASVDADPGPALWWTLVLRIREVDPTWWPRVRPSERALAWAATPARIRALQRGALDLLVGGLLAPSRDPGRRLLLLAADAHTDLRPESLRVVAGSLAADDPIRPTLGPALRAELRWLGAGQPPNCAAALRRRGLIDPAAAQRALGRCDRSWDWQLIRSWSGGEPTQKMISARAAERAVWIALRRLARQVEDVALLQVRTPGDARWRTHDLVADGVAIDVKNARLFDGRIVPEHCVARFKRDRQLGDVWIAGVISPGRSGEDQKTGQFRGPIRWLGLTGRRALDALRDEFEVPGAPGEPARFELPLSPEGAVPRFPPWLYAHPRGAFRPFTDAASAWADGLGEPPSLAAARRWSSRPLARWLVGGRPLPAAWRAELPAWQARLYDRISGGSRTSLPRLYLAALAAAVDAALTRDDSFSPEGLRALLLIDGRPATTWDPMGTLAALIDALDAFWRRVSAQQRAEFVGFRLKPSGILAGRVRGPLAPGAPAWKTVLGWCGGKRGSFKCGRPLSYGEDESCSVCGWLICSECRSCKTAYGDNPPCPENGPRVAGGDA